MIRTNELIQVRDEAQQKRDEKQARQIAEQEKIKADIDKFFTDLDNLAFEGYEEFILEQITDEALDNLMKQFASSSKTANKPLWELEVRCDAPKIMDNAGMGTTQFIHLFQVSGAGERAVRELELPYNDTVNEKLVFNGVMYEFDKWGNNRRLNRNGDFEWLDLLKHSKLWVCPVHFSEKEYNKYPNDFYSAFRRGYGGSKTDCPMFYASTSSLKRWLKQHQIMEKIKDRLTEYGLTITKIKRRTFYHFYHDVSISYYITIKNPIANAQ